MSTYKEILIRRIRDDLKSVPDVDKVLVIGSASETPNIHDEIRMNMNPDTEIVRAKRPDTAEALIESNVFDLVILGKEFRWYSDNGMGNTGFYTQEQLDKMQATVENLSIPLIKLFAE